MTIRPLQRLPALKAMSNAPRTEMQVVQCLLLALLLVLVPMMLALSVLPGSLVTPLLMWVVVAAVDSMVLLMHLNRLPACANRGS
jgi:hypothetical protein